MNFKKRRDDEAVRPLNVLEIYKDLSIPELKEICKQQILPFSVICLNLTGNMNVGSIIRSASLSGARKVYILGRRKYDHRPTVGAKHYIEIEKIRGFPVHSLDPKISVESFYNLIESENLHPIFIEHGGASVIDLKWDNTPFKPELDKEITLVFGCEANGIDPEILYFRENPAIVTIPQLGVIRSHNVSSAAAIVMWELFKFFKY